MGDMARHAKRIGSSSINNDALYLFCMQEEIEKVKKRRLDREKERADQEEMLTQLQRERGIAEAVELERKEEVFHLEQAKARAKQRIRDGR